MPLDGQGGALIGREKAVAWVRRWRRGDLLVVGPLVVVGLAGLLVTGLLVRTVWSWQRQAGADEVEQRTQLARWAVGTATQQYLTTAEQLAASFGAYPDLDLDQLETMVAPLVERGLAGASALVLAVSADDGQVEQTQARWRGLGADGLTLKPVAGAKEHAFTVANVSLDGREQATGLDLMQVPQLRVALAEAQRTGRTTITQPYVLLKDQNLPPQQQHKSFAILAPVTLTSATGTSVAGWVVMGLRAQDMAEQVLPPAVQGMLNMTIQISGATGETTSTWGQTTVASVTTGRQWDDGPISRVRVAVGPQTWTLEGQGTRLVAKTGRQGYLPWVVASSGLLITVLLMLLLNRLFRSRRRALHAADEAAAGRRRAETDSRRDAALLSAVMDSIADGVGVVDRQGRFLLHNRAAKGLLGIREDADDVQDWQEHYGIFLPDGSTPFPVDELPLARALNGEASHLVDMVIRNKTRPEGVMISVSGMPLDAVASGVEGGGAVAVFHDVTERRRLEATLRAEHDRYEQLLGVLSDLGEGVLVTSGFAVVYANEAYAQLVGYDIEELLQLPSTAMLAADDQQLAEFASARAELNRQGVVKTQVARLRHKSGQTVEVEAAGLRVDENSFNLSQSVYVVRDLTERRRWELALAERAEQLQEANRQLEQAREAAEAASRAKSDFLTTMSHEIRTPLNGVLGFTTLLAQSPTHAEAAQWAASADASGRVLLDLVNKGLDMAKIEAGGLSLENVEFDLGTLVDEAMLPVRLSASRAGLQLRARLGPDLVTRRMGDPTRMRQVVTNLVANAVKFTHAGSITVGVTGDDRQVRIEVIDTGIGMNAEEQQRLFAPFQQAATDITRQYGGTGLGLFITHGLVQAMDGEITLTSTPGEGSTFIVSLPLPIAPGAKVPRPRAAGAGKKDPGKGPDVSGLHVLVAEDNPTNQLVARAMLQAKGMTVEVVEDGEQAVAAVQAGRYDAVFMDCQMPNLDGLEATRRIRAAETDRHIPIIAMTANAFEEERQACMDAGMTDFLPKPWKPAQLLDVLTRLQVTRPVRSQR